MAWSSTSRILRSLATGLLPLVLGSCVLVVPWRLALGEWRDGLPHDDLVYKNLSDLQARQSAAATLIGLREKAFRLKDVRVIPSEASHSVLLLASMPFVPPSVPRIPEGASFYRDAVLPVFIQLRWTQARLTRFEVNARIIRSPFHAGWQAVYDATGSGDATPEFLLRRAGDLRSVEEACAMDEALDGVTRRLQAEVRKDLPWVIEEVTR